jgi:hypothetical protein
MIIVLLIQTISLSKSIKYLVLFTSIAVFAIPILILGQQTLAQTSSDFLTYKDPKFGYSIEYPSDWKVFYIGSEPETAFIGTADRSVMVFITVNDSIDRSMSIVDWGKELMEVSKSGAIGPVDLNTNDYSISGIPAARLDAKYKMPNPITGEVQQRVVGLASIINGKGYEIVTSAPDAKFSDYAPTFGRMLYSFKANG